MVLSRKQEAVFYTNSRKKNKEKSKLIKKRGGEFFAFLIYFQKKGELLSFFKNPP